MSQHQDLLENCHQQDSAGLVKKIDKQIHGTVQTHKQRKLCFDKGAKATEQRQSFPQMVLEQWDLHVQKIKVDRPCTLHKMKSKWIIDATPQKMTWEKSWMTLSLGILIQCHRHDPLGKKNKNLLLCKRLCQEHEETSHRLVHNFWKNTFGKICKEHLKSRNKKMNNLV